MSILRSSTRNPESRRLSRRRFLARAAGGVTLAAAPSPSFLAAHTPAIESKPALLGGAPVRTQPFPSWPVIGDRDRSNWSEVLESKNWYRRTGRFVAEFETRWAERLGVRYALATASGTSALYIALNALEIGPGDEVIVPPYTFVATINVVLLQHALPVFVDTDRETSQIDARKIDAAVTQQTRALLPVHLGGAVADLDTILAVARKRRLPVIEDACQAHLAEWRHQKVGTVGDVGCFSFQASKHLNSGEGGAIVGSNAELMRRCTGFQNQGRPYAVDEKGEFVRARGGGYESNGDNRRITEFQAALLLSQLTRLEEQSRRRERNAQNLTRHLKEIPGITPARVYPGCTRNAYHLYMSRYDPEGFAGMPRARFLEALRAEGIPCSGGYRPLNTARFLTQALASRAFRRIYSEKELKDLEERNRCPENDKLCQEAVWFSQTTLLGSREDTDQIITAVRKIQRHAAELHSSSRAPLA